MAVVFLIRRQQGIATQMGADLQQVVGAVELQAINQGGLCGILSGQDQVAPRRLGS
jgi:hypothetical protein